MNPILPAACLAACLVTSAALADTALLIANSRYDEGQSLRDADEIDALAGAFEAAGFEVIAVENGLSADLREALSALLETGEESRVVIAAAGHFAQSASETWLLGREADAPDLGAVSGAGVPVSVMLEIASRAPGRAFVLLGAENRRMELGTGLAAGFGPAAVPQGVTLVTGAPDDLADFVRDTLLEPGADIAAALRRDDDLAATGFLASGVAFLEVPAEGDIAAPEPVATGPDEDEAALWEAARELDSAGSYQAYLDRYPSGSFAAEARQRRDAIRADPVRDARLAEEALSLTRAQRQEIQRDLSILDYNTRGIDGIFGRGTRGAIAGWQEANGFEATTYLTGEQVARLSEQADRRAAELEEQARLRALEQERADRAFWQATGQGRDEAGLRAYLERYPDGLFAGIAEARLDEIERVAREQAAAQERAYWDRVRAADTVEAYRDYLRQYPDGAFAGAAEARIAEIEGGIADPDLRAQLEAREAALNLPPVTRQLIERRLAELGLEPGRVDGEFDRDTRRAIRRYQRARDLEVTGYLDQATVVRLLADTFGAIIRQ